MFHRSSNARSWNLKEHSKLPIAVGFGIKTREHVEQVTSIADAAIVGSEVVNALQTAWMQMEKQNLKQFRRLCH